METPLCGAGQLLDTVGSQDDEDPSGRFQRTTSVPPNFGPSKSDTRLAVNMAASCSTLRDQDLAADSTELAAAQVDTSATTVAAEAAA